MMDGEFWAVKDQHTFSKCTTWLSDKVRQSEKPIYVKAITPKEYRSLAQNRLMHVWRGILSDHTGYELEDMRYLIFKLYGGEETFVNKKTGETETRLKTTTSKDMSVKEFKKFLDFMNRLAGELGVILPQPDDAYWDSIGKDAQ